MDKIIVIGSPGAGKKRPQIYNLLEKYQGNKKIFVFRAREEADKYLKQIASN